MQTKRWMCTFAAALIALSSVVAIARGPKRDKDDDQGRREHGYSRRDQKAIRDWHREHEKDLPPGLAKKDRLPPGLERQLRLRGTLPPGLRDRILPCPEDLERRLPPPPPDCGHVVIGGHIVLLNRKTFMVLDIIHFER